MWLLLSSYFTSQLSYTTLHSIEKNTYSLDTLNKIHVRDTFKNTRHVHTNPLPFDV